MHALLLTATTWGRVDANLGTRTAAGTGTVQTVIYFFCPFYSAREGHSGSGVRKCLPSVQLVKAEIRHGPQSERPFLFWFWRSLHFRNTIRFNYFLCMLRDFIPVRFAKLCSLNLHLYADVNMLAKLARNVIKVYKLRD